VPEWSVIIATLKRRSEVTCLDALAADSFTDYEVALKVSGAVAQSNLGFPYADLEEHLHWLVEHFGRERLIWGSDFPNVSDEASYGQTLAWLDHVDWLSDGDREWLVGRSYDQFV